MSETNHIRLIFDAIGENEAFARMAVAGFLVELDPSVEELEDVRTAVSEAVTNAVVHGYEDSGSGQVELSCERTGRAIVVKIVDQGVGIEDVEEAMKPFYTTKSGQERAGMGFAFMEAFMDSVRVSSAPGEGTTVVMKKYISDPELRGKDE